MPCKRRQNNPPTPPIITFAEKKHPNTRVSLQAAILSLIHIFATLFGATIPSIEYNESQAYFPVKQGIPNEGIVAPKSVAMLYDDPLFLTKSGVQALTSKMISAERIVEARSSRINARLSREEHLADAVACIWNGYYLLFVGGHVYVADSRQKSYLRQTSESFEYLSLIHI